MGLSSSRDTGLAWHRTRQALEQACERGELFNLKIANRRWYPAVFAGLNAEQVKAVCHALQGLDAVSSFVFSQRPQGSLGGKMVAEALQAGQLPSVLRAADVVASEQTN